MLTKNISYRYYRLIRIMKKTGSLGHLVMLLLFIPFYSCIQDDLDDPNSSIEKDSSEYVNVELPGYFNMRLSEATINTRAEETDDHDYDDGINSEFSIAPGEGNHFIVIYKTGDNNSLPSAIIPLTITGEDIRNDGDTYNNLTLTIHRILTASKFSKDFEDLTALKTFLEQSTFFVLLNFDKSQISSSDNTVTIESTTLKTLQNIRLEKFLKLYLSDYKISRLAQISTNEVVNVDYFTMTNSVYGDQDASTKLSYGQVINPDYVYDTQEKAEAEASEGHVALNLWVERLAAKVSIKEFKETNGYLNKYTGYAKIFMFAGVNAEDNYSYNDTDQRDWYATVLGYGVNALEPDEYLIKKLNTGNNYFTGWTKPGEHRSFWADDLHYTINGNLNNYPHQYRRALENKDINGYHDGSHDDDGNLAGFSSRNSKYYLNYVSLNSIIDKKSVMYPLENTYNDSDPTPGSYLGDRGYFSAGTHLLVACRLKIDNLADGTDLYRDQHGYFYTNPATLLSTKLMIMQNKILSGGNSGLRVLNADWFNHAPNSLSDLTTISWNAGDKLQISEDGVLREMTYEDLTFIPAELAGGDGQLLIAPLNRDAEYFIGEKSLNFFNEVGCSYNMVVSLFHKEMGAIDHFKDGLMYYPTAIPHNAQTIAEMQWDRVGDLGVVRNNWYRFTINGVTAPGIPVDQPDQPIIPMMDVKRNYLNVTVNVAKWHELSTGAAPLYPSL